MEKMSYKPEKAKIISLDTYLEKKKREALLKSAQKRRLLAEELGLPKDASDEEIVRVMAIRWFDLPDDTTSEELEKMGMNIFSDLHAKEYEKQQKNSPDVG